MEPEYLKRYNLSKGITSSISKLLWGVIRLIYDQCDLIITPSDWVAKDLKSRKFSKAIKVVNNGIDLAEFAQEVDEKKTRFLINKYGLSDRTLLYVGRLSEEKGLDTLLESVKLLKPKLPGVKLLLAGDGPFEKGLKKLAGDLDIDQEVIFLGRVNHPDLGQSGLYEVSQIFVNPSTSETFSLVTVEAMAKGLPVIVADARAVTELVKDNGFIFVPSDPVDLSNKITKLISNKDLMLTMSSNSRKASLDYSLEKLAENLEKSYLEAVKL